MSNQSPYEGRSQVSFRDAARKAVHAAELGHVKENPGSDPPEQEYEITLKAKAKPGSSLSEYIVIATPPS
jgi:hypothetical protein